MSIRVIAFAGCLLAAMAFACSPGENVELVGSYDTPRDAWIVEVSGSLAYVTVPYYGLQIIDVSDPRTPVLVGSYDTPGKASGVAISGSLVYVADQEGGLVILRYTGPVPQTP